jgi:chromosome segregation ATPase
LSSSTQRLKDITHQAGLLSARTEELRSKRATNIDEIAHLKAQIKAIRDQQSEDPYLAGAQAVVSCGFANVYGPLGRLIQCDNAHRDIISSTLGEHLGDMVAETSVDAEKAIEYLKTEGKGRVRIWILDRLTSQNLEGALTNPASGQSLASLIKTEAKFVPLITHLASSMWIQDANVYGRAVINGGSDPSQWKTHLVHRIPEMEQELLEKEQRQQELNEAIHLLDTEIASTAGRKESAMKEMEEARVRLELAEEERNKNKKHLELLEEELQTVGVEIEQLQANKESIQTSHANSLESFDTLQAQEKTDHERLDSLQHNLTETQKYQQKRRQKEESLVPNFFFLDKNLSNSYVLRRFFQ